MLALSLAKRGEHGIAGNATSGDVVGFAGSSKAEAAFFGNLEVHGVPEFIRYFITQQGCVA